MTKRTKNDLQNITHKTKDRVTQTKLKPDVNSGAPDSGYRRVTLVVK